MRYRPVSHKGCADFYPALSLQHKVQVKRRSQERIHATPDEESAGRTPPAATAKEIYSASHMGYVQQLSEMPDRPTLAAAWALIWSPDPQRSAKRENQAGVLPAWKKRKRKERKKELNRLQSPNLITGIKCQQELKQIGAINIRG